MPGVQVLMRRGQDYITHHLPSIHRDMSGMSRVEARVQFIRDLSTPPATHNMHFYRLRRRKYDPPPGKEWLAVCPRGIEIYEVGLAACAVVYRVNFTRCREQRMALNTVRFGQLKTYHRMAALVRKCISDGSGLT